MWMFLMAFSFSFQIDGNIHVGQYGPWFKRGRNARFGSMRRRARLKAHAISIGATPQEAGPLHASSGTLLFIGLRPAFQQWVTCKTPRPPWPLPGYRPDGHVTNESLPDADGKRRLPVPDIATRFFIFRLSSDQVW